MAKSERAIPRFLTPPAYLGGVCKTLESNIDAKIGIDSLTGAITQKPWSHKGAWSRLLLSALKGLGLPNVSVLPKGAKWSDYDVIILEHGMEFDGTFNVYGGANDELAERIEQFLNYTGEILSYEVPMPDIGEFAKARSSSCTPRFAVMVAAQAALSEKSKAIKFFDAVDPSSHLVIGDSHSLSVWVPGAEIRRHDGKTLYGVLKDGLAALIGAPKNYTKITVYFGNIDVRHHLCRQEDPVKAAESLASQYAAQLRQLNELGIEIEAISLLPIEDESRKLPKTGYYKGEPFAGSWTDRNGVRVIFNSLLKQLSVDGDKKFFSVYEWPACFLDEGKLSFDVMERPKSVHVSPEWYRTNLETGQEQVWPAVRPPRKKVEDTDDDEPTTPANTEPPLPGAAPVKPAKAPKTARTTVFGRTAYYPDFIEYYRRALELQRRNLGLTFTPVNDDLMNAVSIYDTVNRRYAGFSKVLEDLHYGPEPIKYRQARSKKAYTFTHAQWQYIHLVHRITGSGASFEKDHGYRNTIVFEVADAMEQGGIDLAKEVVLKWDRESKAMFTSIGNQIPPFNKPTPPFTRGGIEYLVNYAPRIAHDYASWLVDQARAGNRIGIREAVDYVLDLQSSLGLKRYAFVLTAFVMDSAEYFPYLVDPSSHCYYGKNCQESLELIGEIDGRKEDGYDLIMDSLCSDCESIMAQFIADRQMAGQPTPETLPLVADVPVRKGTFKAARPYDMEDVACDYIRYIENYVPDNKLGSYRHLDLKTLFHNSSIQRHPKGRQRWMLEGTPEMTAMGSTPAAAVSG
jgi:hypothetical protein